MGESVQFDCAAGAASGYLASPAVSRAGVVVIQDWWGLVPHIEDVAERFAALGYLALAPDLYWESVVSAVVLGGQAGIAPFSCDSRPDRPPSECPSEDLSGRAGGAGRTVRWLDQKPVRRFRRCDFSQSCRGTSGHDRHHHRPPGWLEVLTC